VQTLRIIRSRQLRESIVSARHSRLHLHRSPCASCLPRFPM
jgi:hypothetical protein